MKKTPKRLVFVYIISLFFGGYKLFHLLIYSSNIHSALSARSMAYAIGAWSGLIVAPLFLIVGVLCLFNRKKIGRGVSLVGLILSLWPGMKAFYQGFIETGPASSALPVTITVYFPLVAIWAWLLYSKKSTQFLFGADIQDSKKENLSK